MMIPIAQAVLMELKARKMEVNINESISYERHLCDTIQSV